MKKCDTCKHYLSVVWDECVPQLFGHLEWDKETDKRKVPKEYGQCGLIGMQLVDGTQKAVVSDGSGYLAAIICRQDFGCVLHEEKV